MERIMIQPQKPIFKRLFSLKNLIIFFLFLLFFLLLILFMDYMVMPLYTKHGEEFELPDVTDKTIQVALETLDGNGFNPIIKDSVYDEHFSPGSVIQQNPLPYSRVKKGRRVYLVVSIGEKPIFVPRLIGLTPQDAEFRLKEENLRLNRTIYEFSDFFPRGVVINQSIPAGEEVEKHKRINITVSLGPAPTSLEIPNLIGKSIQTAEKELDVLGVRIGLIKYSYRPKLVPGTILNQSISAGTNAARVDSINLLVSSDEPPLEPESGEDSLEEGEEIFNEENE